MRRGPATEEFATFASEEFVSERTSREIGVEPRAQIGPPHGPLAQCTDRATRSARDSARSGAACSLIGQPPLRPTRGAHPALRQRIETYAVSRMAADQF